MDTPKFKISQGVSRNAAYIQIGRQPRRTSVEILEAELRRHFEAELAEAFPLAAKRSNLAEPLTHRQIAWLYRVKHLATAITGVSRYSRAKLVAAIDELRPLRMEPEGAREVPRILREAGVRFIVVEGLPGLKVDGVCFWQNSSPVVGLSLRFDRIDNFWFVLRHELEHVLREDAKGQALVEVVVDSEETTLGAQLVTSVAEREANEAASHFCIPREEMEDFMARTGRYLSANKITGFARRIAVHPGIVVGQLHNRGVLPFRNLRKTLVKVRSHVCETAMADGWGSLPQAV